MQYKYIPGNYNFKAGDKVIHKDSNGFENSNKIGVFVKYTTQEECFVDYSNFNGYEGWVINISPLFPVLVEDGEVNYAT